MTERAAPDPREFKAGIYEHYKGGKYIALHIAKHHDSSEWFVVYMSVEHLGWRVREWNTPGQDSWCDIMSVQLALDGTEHPVSRFRYLEPLL